MRWQQAINLSALSLFPFPKLFPQPPLYQHCSVVIVNSKAGWSMEMLNKAAGLLPQRLWKTRFARSCVPVNISRKVYCLLPSSPVLLCDFLAPLLEVVSKGWVFQLVFQVKLFSKKWTTKRVRFFRNRETAESIGIKTWIAAIWWFWLLRFFDSFFCCRLFVCFFLFMHVKHQTLWYLLVLLELLCHSSGMRLLRCDG